MKPGDLVRINPRWNRGEILRSGTEYNSTSIGVAYPGEPLLVLAVWSQWAGFDGGGTHYTQILTPQGLAGWLLTVNVERIIDEAR